MSALIASLHVELIKDRDAWFSKMGESYQALLWIPAGHIPSIEEAQKQLEYIRKHGPSAQAFTFAKAYPRPMQALNTLAEYLV